MGSAKGSAVRSCLFALGAVVAMVACVLVVGLAIWQRMAPSKKEPAKTSVEVKKDDATARVQDVVEELTLEQKVAQLFVVTPEALTGVDVATMSGPATQEAIEECPVGGICYFAQNLVDREQTTEMLHNVQEYSAAACGLPLFACVDEEGGLVTRVASNEAFGVENVGDMARVGATEDLHVAEEVGRTIGGYLKDLGFNVDFAPVADVATLEDGTMAQRSFGNDPELVASMVAAQVRGFDEAGVLCCAKHFPGIGGAEGDSHEQSIYSYDTMEQMDEGPLVPFKAAVRAKVPMVMVGHLSCMGLDGVNDSLPASLNPDVIGGILRKRLNYDGLVITDSLEMEAVAEACAPSEQGVQALRAGADLVLMPLDFFAAYEGLLDAVRDGVIEEARIDESVSRIVAAKLAMDGDA